MKSCWWSQWRMLQWLFCVPIHIAVENLQILMRVGVSVIQTTWFCSCSCFSFLFRAGFPHVPLCLLISCDSCSIPYIMLKHSKHVCVCVSHGCPKKLLCFDFGFSFLHFLNCSLELAFLIFLFAWWYIVRSKTLYNFIFNPVISQFCSGLS